MTAVSDELLQKALNNLDSDEPADQSMNFTLIHAAGKRGLLALFKRLRNDDPCSQHILHYLQPLCRSLGMPEEVLAEMQWLIGESKSPYIRVKLMELVQYLMRLSKIQRSILPWIVPYTLDNEASMRYAALNALANYKPEAAIPYLGLLLEDEDSAVQKLSLRMLNNYNSPQARYILHVWRQQQSHD